MAVLHMPLLTFARRIPPEERKALLLAFVAGVLPLSRPLASLSIALLLLHELWQYARTKRAYFSRPLKASMLLFLLYAGSVFYSTDWLFAWHKLETKFCLLLCPLIFGLNVSSRAGRYLPNAFVAGNLLAVLYSLARAAEDSFTTGVNHFHYMKLGEYLHFHPTVFSLYLFVAVFLLMKSLPLPGEGRACLRQNGVSIRNSSCLARLRTADIPSCFGLGMVNRKSLFRLGLMLLFLLFILLLSARMAMLSGFVLLAIYLFVRLKNVWGRAKSLLALSMALVLGASVAWSIPSTRFRLQVLLEGIEQNNRQPNVRWEIWDAAVFLIERSSFFGYGLGDVDRVLMSTYEVLDYCKPYGEHYNAHNQFLETTLALGWPGLLSFLALFFTAFRQTKKNLVQGSRSVAWTARFFVLLLLLNFLTESLLEMQQSLMFFALFFSYFFYRP